LLESTLKTLNITDPSQIYNVDETGCSGHLGCAEKVIVKKGARQAFKVEIALGEHITVNMAISASGATIPPQFIFSKTLPRADGLPYNWTYECSQSGFMNSDIFTKWFRNVFVPSFGPKRPCLLIMDNLSSHLTTNVIDAAIENDVTLLFLPAHTVVLFIFALSKFRGKPTRDHSARS